MIIVIIRPSSPTTQSRHGRTLHDRIFKEFLHRFLPDFLHLFFPAEAARLDFTTLTFLDQELVVNLPGQSLRITDVVAETATLEGEGEVIIIHVEVEGRDRRGLPQRMFEYYSLLPLALVLLPHAGGLTWSEKREREGELRGELRGEIKGKTEVLLRLLRHKFGRLPEAFVERLQAIDDTAILDELSDQVLTAVTLDDITLPD